MRGFFRFIGLLIAAAIIAALAIFAVDNINLVPLHYVGQSFNGNLWWVCIGSAVLGFILAFLLLAPGRVAAGWRGRALGRERTRLQDELAVVRAREANLRAEYEQLRAQHEQVSAERDHLRQTAAPAATATAPAAASAATPGTTSATSAPLVPPAETAGATIPASAASAPAHPPTFGERLRGAFNRPAQPQPTEADYTQRPPVPTA